VRLQWNIAQLRVLRIITVSFNVASNFSLQLRGSATALNRTFLHDLTTARRSKFFFVICLIGVFIVKTEKSQLRGNYSVSVGTFQLLHGRPPAQLRGNIGVFLSDHECGWRDLILMNFVLGMSIVSFFQFPVLVKSWQQCRKQYNRFCVSWRISCINYAIVIYVCLYIYIYICKWKTFRNWFCMLCLSRPRLWKHIAVIFTYLTRMASLFSKLCQLKANDLNLIFCFKVIHIKVGKGGDR
jgi:hypothetical protein